MKRILPCLLALSLILAGCQTSEQTTARDATTKIELSDNEILVNGTAITADPLNAVYAEHDVVFYLAGQDFTYGEGTEDDAHEQEDADAHTVVHITKPGTYSLSGTLSKGQIAVDLGKDAEENSNAVVNLILNGVDITCDVAPGIIFYNVYECSSDDADNASATVDTRKAGANLLIADGTENTVNGSYVARIYESYELNKEGTEVIDSEKLHKYDGAVYSRMSMNVSGGEIGDGVLNINAENEGLDTELHLTINGGNLNINSGNDGINTNEDGVSVTTINGGTVNILVNGSTGEGDGIDSNGWLVINGGTVIASACDKSADAGIDSDLGIHLNGGTVIASGNMLDRISDSKSTYAVFSFAEAQDGGLPYTLKDANGNTVLECTPANGFTSLVLSSSDLKAGTYTLWQGETQLQGSNGGFGGGFGGPMPEDMEPPEGMERPDGMQRGERPQDFDPSQLPERGERPEGMTPPNGEMPQNPGGNRSPGRGANIQISPENLSTDFTIVEGTNYFSFVTTVA